ncbi:MAG: S-layer homology domain-containing protein [Clostridia bacterium]|nr:S-layer homology domain-containing protein [Clostridia bacterium]
MKKLSAILLTVCMLVTSLAMFVNASPHGIIENDPVAVPTATPTIDGTIDEADGWSEPAKMNYDTCGFFWQHNPLSTKADIYFAYDETGLYYAADITEGLECFDERTGEDMSGKNSFVYSTGEDWIDVNADDPTEHYGYDGDVFGLLVDPAEGMINAGFSSDYTPWYMIGLFEGEDGDVAKMYRQKINKGDITDVEGIEVVGTKTETGWRFEAKIAWDIIIADLEAITYGDVILTVDDIIANGVVSKVAGMYQDRFYDEEAGEVATWGRYVTAPTSQVDGTPGHMGSGDLVCSCGITLVAGGDAYENPFIDVKDNHWFAESVKYCVQKGYVTGMTENTFVPNGNITRAQFLVMLAKLDGVDLTKYDTTDAGFEDVKTSHWYNEVVCWAVENEFTSGLSATKFGPNANITRSQLARFLYVYSEKNGINVEGKADLSVFPDAASVQSWATDSVSWAVDAGIIGGVAKDGVNYLQPNGTATRAQATVMFKAFDAFRK